MKKALKNSKSLIIALFEMFVGVILLIRPIGFTSAVIIAAGIVFSISGVYSIIKYFASDIGKVSQSMLIYKGGVSLISGLICIAKHKWFIATFPVITVIYGAILMLVTLYKLQIALNFVRLKVDKWYLSAISTVICGICASVIIINPFTGTTILWVFTGIAMLVQAFVDFAGIILKAAYSDSNKIE